MEIDLPLPNKHHAAALVQPWEHHVSGAGIARAAQLGDRLGFHKLGSGEHFAIPRELVPTSGSHYPQSTTMLAFLAGHTSQIQLSSHVTILPLQHPLIHAKMWAVLDWLSGGRAHMVIGSGWLESEFAMLGVSYSDRGRICDEYVAAMIEIWTQPDASFEGNFASFQHASADPKSIRQPHVPLWFAGDVPAVFRRIARWGSGWSPYQTAPQDFPKCLDAISASAGYHGQPIGVWFDMAQYRLGFAHVARQTGHDLQDWSASELIDHIAQLGSLGVTEVTPLVPQCRDFEAYLDWVRWLADSILPVARTI